MLTHQNLVANAVQAYSMLPGGVTEDDMTVCALPLFHVYALTMCMNLSIYTGIPMLLVPAVSMAELVQLIERYRPTLFPAVQTMYVALTRVIPPGSDALSSLRVCNSGGAPMPVQVMEAFESFRRGLRSWRDTGCRKLLQLRTSIRLQTAEELEASACPRPTRTCELSTPRIAAYAPVGEIGELAVRGPQVMKGYWNRPEETAETLVDGWLFHR